MKEKIILAAASCLLLAGCGGGSDGASLHAAPLWSAVGDKTTCEAEQPAACSGYYGFTIDSQGNYSAGPNPQGQSATGALSAAEWSQLQAAANTLSSDIQAEPTALCTTQPATAGTSDTVQITVAGVPFYVQDGANRLCAYGGHTADSTALIDLVDTLRAKYYVL